jgi:hypothetical protein
VAGIDAVTTGSGRGIFKEESWDESVNLGKRSGRQFEDGMDLPMNTYRLTIVVRGQDTGLI